MSSFSNLLSSFFIEEMIDLGLQNEASGQRNGRRACLERQTDKQTSKKATVKLILVSFCFDELLLQTLPMEIKLQLSFCLLSSPANQSYFPSSFSESYLLHSNWEIFNYSPARFKQKSPFSSLKINTSLECQGVDFLRNVEVINLTEGSI